MKTFLADAFIVELVVLLNLHLVILILGHRVIVVILKGQIRLKYVGVLIHR